MKKKLTVFWPLDEGYSVYETGEKATSSSNTAIVENIITYDEAAEVHFDDRSEMKISRIPFLYEEKKC